MLQLNAMVKEDESPEKKLARVYELLKEADPSSKVHSLRAKQGAVSRKTKVQVQGETRYV